MSSPYEVCVSWCFLALLALCSTHGGGLILMVVEGSCEESFFFLSFGWCGKKGTIKILSEFNLLVLEDAVDLFLCV